MSAKPAESETVTLTVYIPEQLRQRGHGAIRMIGYNDMTEFITAKLEEAIQEASQQFSTPKRDSDKKK